MGNEFDAAMLARACAGKKTSLKAALLDQRVVAGLGNIYVCEALFRAGLSPKRQASTIADRNGKPERARGSAGRCHSRGAERRHRRRRLLLRDHRQADGALGDFQHHFRVYDREGEPCPNCKGKIKRIVQNGRSTFYCPHARNSGHRRAP